MHVHSQFSDGFHLSHTILTVELVLKQAKSVLFKTKFWFRRQVLCLFSAFLTTLTLGIERTSHGSAWIFCAFC